MIFLLLLLIHVIIVLCIVLDCIALVNKHSWQYTNDSHRVCNKCGQRQVLYESMRYDEDSSWIGEGDWLATPICSNSAKQNKLRNQFKSIS